MNYYTPKTKIFVSFDYDHDEDLKNLFCGQAKLPSTPFDIKDNSVREALAGDWKEKVKQRIRGVDQVVVICGQYTHTATGVSAEVEIAQELGKPYFLLKGRSDKTCYAPTSAKSTDSIYRWTWENVGLLLQGNR